MTESGPPTTSFSRPGAPAVEQAALAFREALASGGSALSPGEPVWTLGHAEELRQAFNGQPDVGGSSFDAKLANQLGGVSQGAIQLFAELYCLDLLPLSDYKPETKRQLIKSTLQLGGLATEVPEVVDRGLGAGVLNGGVAFKTRRYFQMCWLVEMAEKLLALSVEARQQLLDDPLAFRRAVLGLPTNAPSQRATLLYLMFPDFFLPIAKDEHRQLIRQAYIGRLASPSGDIDTDLRQIYDLLRANAGQDIDLYLAPYREQWDPNAAASTTYDGSGWTKLLAWAARIVPLVDLDSARRRPALELGTRLAAVRTAWLDNQSDWLPQLASALDGGFELVDPLVADALSDRMPGGPPGLGALWRERGAQEPLNGLTELDVSLLHNAEAAGWASFLLLARDASLWPPFRQTALGLARAITGSAQTGTSPSDLYRDWLALCDQVIERGGETGKDVADRLDASSILWAVLEAPIPSSLSPQDAEVLRALRAQGAVHEAVPPIPEVTLSSDDLRLSPVTADLASSLHIEPPWLQKCVDLLEARRQLIFYGPPGTGKTYIAKGLADHIAPGRTTVVQFHPAYSYEDFFEGFRPTSAGGFELKKGPLRRVAEAARLDPASPYVLVIDEINRGNLAKIFGELYFLLEYRQEGVELLYSEEEFRLPKNVYLVGTMNTADRSIALVDSAMRRRFPFLALHPSEQPTSEVLRKWLLTKPGLPDVADLLDRLNRRIDDEDFRIGPSYFMNEQAISSDGGLELIWETSIMPLLEEHHYGELTRAEVDARYGLEAIKRSATSADDLSG